MVTIDARQEYQTAFKALVAAVLLLGCGSHGGIVDNGNRPDRPIPGEPPSDTPVEGPDRTEAPAPTSEADESPPESAPESAPGSALGPEPPLPLGGDDGYTIRILAELEEIPQPMLDRGPGDEADNPESTSPPARVIAQFVAKGSDGSEVLLTLGRHRNGLCRPEPVPGADGVARRNAAGYLTSVCGPAHVEVELPNWGVLELRAFGDTVTAAELWAMTESISTSNDEGD